MAKKRKRTKKALDGGVAGAGGHFSEKFRSSAVYVFPSSVSASPSLPFILIHSPSFFLSHLLRQTMSTTAEEGPSPALGVRVSLPPGTLAAQRERELARRSQHNQQQQQQQQQEEQAVEDEEEEHDDEGPRPIGIDLDREIVPFHLGGDGNSSDGSSNSEPDLQDEEDASSSAASDDIDDDDDDDISQSPPTSLPLLSIDLIELTGCKPSNAEEKDMLVDQVRAILVGEHNEDGSAKEEEEETKRPDGAEEGPPPEESEANDEQEPQWMQFNDRSTELFSMGAASHDDTTHRLSPDDLHHCQLEYPEFLPVPGAGEHSATTVVMPTSRIWKTLTSSHRVAPVDRILVHLSRTSRDLVWRYQMNTELRHLARTELAERDRRHRTAALEEWTAGGRRKLELERLYQVRGTFEYRLNAARKGLREVVGQREDRVRSELGRRREAGISGGGVDGLDWAEGAATFVFGDEDMERQNLREVTPSSDLAPMTAPYQDGQGDDEPADEPYGSSASEESGYELDEDSLADGESDDEDGHAGADESKSSSDKLSQSRSEARVERRRIRAAKSSKRMRKKLALQEEEAKRRSMVEAAKAEEQDIRRMCTLPEEELAKAVVDQLEERMTKIDALLEKMQDEEWAEEEGDDMTSAIQKKQDGLQFDVLYDNLDEERQHRPLLDQILAMIFGAARLSDGRTKEKHFEFVRDEHQSIVSDWWKYFGRLPPSLAEKEEAAAKFTTKKEDTLLVAGALTALRFDDDSGATKSKKISLPEIPPKQTPEAMRSMLGITDNDGDDWDDVDVDDWGAFGFADNSVTTSSTGASGQDTQIRPNNNGPKKGLRPGGRML